MNDDQFRKLYDLIQAMGQNMATKEDITQVYSHVQNLSQDMATRKDIAQIYGHVQSLSQEMATKEDIAEIKEDIDHIKNILDQHFGMLDTDETERLALSKQVDRHEDWIIRAAKKTSVRYAEGS